MFPREGMLVTALKQLVTAVTVALALIGCDVDDLATRAAPSPTSVVIAPTPSRPTGGTDMERATVRRVVDGDTIIVNIRGREERLRYIGIDTPESVQPDTPVECYGREAADANARLVAGRTVYLERDVSDRDRYGRLLRYVYVDDPASGGRLFVNLELVAQGYAYAATFPPDVRHASTFREAEREARDAGRGLWSTC